MGDVVQFPKDRSRRLTEDRWLRFTEELQDLYVLHLATADCAKQARLVAGAWKTAPQYAKLDVWVREALRNAGYPYQIDETLVSRSNIMDWLERRDRRPIPQ